MESLLANRWLEADDRETVSDLDAEIEERDAYYASAGRLAYEPLPC